MSKLDKVRVQLLDENTNQVLKEVDVLTSAECVVCEDGENLQEKINNGSIAGGNGTAGRDGKSAYEIYVDNVPLGEIVLSETEWLQSLRGEQGAKGEQGEKGEKGDKGDSFSIKKTYASISEMEADYSNSTIPVGSFVLINTDDVEDEDNAKLFVKGETAYSFVTDLSGATGIKGEKGEKGEKGDSGLQGLAQTTVVIIDDDGTNRILDNYTGMLSWLNNQNIPLTLACISTTIGTSGKLTLEQLHNLEAQGNEVVCHSSVEDKSNTMTEENYKNILGSAKQWMIDNGFTKGKDIFVYPQGINSDGVSTAKRVQEMVGEYFKYGLNVNISSSTADYDIDTKGVWNKVPLKNRLNISRMEINESKGLGDHKKNIDNCLNEKGLIILFTHSFRSSFATDGLANFKEVVTYLKDNNCKFVTASEALNEIEESLAQKIEDVVNKPTEATDCVKMGTELSNATGVKLFFRLIP